MVESTVVPVLKSVAFITTHSLVVSVERGVRCIRTSLELAIITGWAK